MDFYQVKTYYGTPVKAAKALGVTRQTLYRWRDSGIPIDIQLKVEVATNGHLRADLPMEVRLR